MADAKYKFIYCNVGVNGRTSDCGVFRESGLFKAMSSGNLLFPLNRPLPGRMLEVPYVIVADDAFPLSARIMKPFPCRGLTYEQKVFNYRLSRARRIIESAFGILANRFKILLNPINLNAEKVEIITLACVALHNYLATENWKNYTEISQDKIIANLLEKLPQQGSNRSVGLHN
ncbi:uncharacterized protein LOC115883754 [Sitophilus oryzae]|uniref:Uncharacterized protein LOC115883754 n=1 Tax=Sitophilus oryzae TaxID=7048 RepID=A0A6J2Y2H1_SITOR|nr:uncharacterized protein LOC115883754 [Sitophilus oryzae]